MECPGLRSCSRAGLADSATWGIPAGAASEVMAGLGVLAGGSAELCASLLWRGGGLGFPGPRGPGFDWGGHGVDDPADRLFGVAYPVAHARPGVFVAGLQGLVRPGSRDDENGDWSVARGDVGSSVVPRARFPV